MKSALTASEWNAGMRYVASAGGSVAVRERGNGPPLLLIHGFPTWSYDWARLAQRLPGRKLILPDLLGFGWSDKPRHAYTIAKQADAVTAAILSGDVGSLDLVAHDYGTIVAQELIKRQAAGKLPFRINKVALLNAGIIWSLHRPVRIQKLLMRPIIGRLVSALATEGQLHAGLDAVTHAGFSIPDDQWAVLYEGVTRRGGHRLGHRLIHYIAERRQQGDAWEAALLAHSAPIALIWGMTDPVSGRHVLEVARRRYPSAQVIELSNVGHYPQIEAPDAVADALTSFLDRM